MNASSIHLPLSRRLRLSALLAVAALPCTPPTAHAINGGWEYQPYRIHAMLALDLPGGLADQLSAELPAYLQRRAAAALTPAWALDVQLAAGAERAAVFSTLAAASDAKPAALAADKDKFLLLAVRWTPIGFDLSAREYDAYIQRWGAPLRRECQQESALLEQLFALAWQAIAPLAQFEVDASDPQLVTLKPRGAALPHGADAPPWSQPGDVFAPILRRTSRSGQLVENGIVPVPWTFIEATEGKDKSLIFRINSGSRRPFAARRQGRVEQLAIGVRADAEPTTLYLHSRKSDKKPLIGYEVLAENAGQESPSRVGTSDAAGEVRISPGKSRIEVLLIKHGGHLLAKLPVAPGAERRLNVPLPDDDARLTAESRLAAVREDLIDVVARRNILISRTRQKIEKKDFAAAQELLRSLDDLPGNPQFTLTLTTAARLLRSDDPQIQRRIDQLFKATQTLTAQFLDLKPINRLHDELREAQQKAPPKTGKT